MKLNTKRTMLVGLAFLSICIFWQMYDSVMTLILTDTFHLNETIAGAVMAADNVLALFLLPLFGALSDKTNTRIGRRMPYIIGGTAAAVVLMNLLPVLDNAYAASPSPLILGLFIAVLALLLVAILAGGLAAGLMGIAVGIPALRLRGDYLAIVTMAFAEIIRVCFCNFSITGGGKTMSGILKLSTFDRAFWIMVVCVTVMFLFVRSRFGRTVQAIREDYIAASASGINVTYYKVLTFAVSAFFAGVGGSVYAHYMTAMIPTNFNFNYSAELLSEVIIGGTGSLTGSIIGAAFLSSLPELMRDFSTYRMLAYSVVLVLVMLFRPGGIFGRWEFSLTRLLDGIRHPKAKAAKGA